MTDIDDILNVADQTAVEDAVIFEDDEVVNEESGAKLWIKRGWIIFQAVIIMYLLVNEFMGHRIQGIFLILLFT